MTHSKSFLPVLNVYFTPKRGNVIQLFLCCGIHFHTFVCYFAFPTFEKLQRNSNLRRCHGPVPSVFKSPSFPPVCSLLPVSCRRTELPSCPCCLLCASMTASGPIRSSEASCPMRRYRLNKVRPAAGFQSCLTI